MKPLDLFVPHKTPSHRQQRVAREIRDLLSQLLMQRDLPPVIEKKTGETWSFSSPITVTEVEASPDLRHATAFVMPLGGTEGDKALKFLTQNQWYVRKFLSTKLRLRVAPEIHFRLDKGFERVEQLNKLMEPHE